MSVFLFIVILLLLIIVHEFGHFIVAKKSGIRVDEFGIGFPPKAKTLAKRGDTEYTLNWLPFGGFVRIFGENPDEESLHGPDRERSFGHKSKWVQASVLIAGVFFNMLLAWILLTGMFMVGTDIAITEEERTFASDIRLVVSHVLPESPAGDVGLVPGDVILSMQSEEEFFSNTSPEEAVSFIATHSEGPITVEVERGSEILTLSLLPEDGLIPGAPERKALGISMTNVGFLQYLNPLKALWEGWKFMVDVTALVANGLFTFFASLFVFEANFSDVAGPVGIVSFVGEAAAMGFSSLLFLTAIISINLAIINILPIPALDGGRLLFLLIEAIKGSPIEPKVANTIHALFFGLLILLILVVSYFDIARLFG
jgi:regulator of sigma E protease